MKTEVNHLLTSKANFSDWAGTYLGRLILEQETELVNQLLPRRYYPVAVQLGPAVMNCLDRLSSRVKVFVDSTSGGDAPPHRVLSDWGYLPFGARSVDLLVLPHTLEFAEDPHHVLREIHEVVVPEGHLVVCGFNPVSSWGMVRAVRKWTGRPPWQGNRFRVHRVQDWLSVLGFELVAAKMGFYRPPLSHETALKKLEFLEKSGDRWWPGLAAVYILVVKKKQMQIRSIVERGRVRSRAPVHILDPVARRGRRLVADKRRMAL